jgi:hypothetical protein
MKGGYPNEQGKQGRGLPDLKTPLTINADKGDVLVPENDMANVAGKFGSGGEPVDPMGFLKEWKK